MLSGPHTNNTLLAPPPPPPPQQTASSMIGSSYMFTQQGQGPDPQAFLFSRAGQSSDRELASLLPLDAFTATHGGVPPPPGATIIMPGHDFGLTGSTSPSGLTLASVIGGAPPSPMQVGAGGYVVMSQPHPNLPPSPPNTGNSQPSQVTPMMFTQNNGGSASGFLHMTSSANTSGAMGMAPYGTPPNGNAMPQQIVFSHAQPVVQASNLQVVAGPNGSFTLQAVPTQPNTQGGYMLNAQGFAQPQQTFLAYNQHGGVPSQSPHMLQPQLVQAPSPAQFFMHMHAGNSGAGSTLHPAQQGFAASPMHQAPPQMIQTPTGQHLFMSSALHASPPPPPPPPAMHPQMQQHAVLPAPSGMTPSSTGALRKRSKKSKKALLTPRSQAAKELAQRQKELEKASKGGKPFDEEPFELDPAKKQLIVNFVSQTVSDEEFRSLFTPFGELAASRIIYDKHTHRSKGYGFVYFKKGEDAIAAIKALNGIEMHAKALKVGYATPQRPNPPEDDAEDGDGVGLGAEADTSTTDADDESDREDADAALQ